MVSMPNLKTTKLAGGRPHIGTFIPNVVEKPFPHIPQEGIDFMSLPLDDQLNPSIGKVLHIADNVEPTGDRVRRVSKPDALNMTRV